MPSAVRIAILGCGAITRSEHLSTVLAHPDVQLSALVDKDVARAKLLAQGRGVDCEIVSDHRSIRGSIDAVINALPNQLHAPVTLECLQAGIHVLCEKPLATTSADARSCAEAAEKHQRVLAVGMNRRFVASHALLHLILSQGLLGSLQEYDCQYGGAFDWKSASGFYFSRELAGGGALIDFGVHLLDSLLDWFGDVEDFKYQDDNWGSGIEANAILRVKHRGSYGDIAGTLKVSRTHSLKNRLLVRGSNAEAEISVHDPDSVVIYLSMAGSRVASTLRFADPYPQTSFYRQLDNFVASIRGTAKPVVEGLQAARVLRLIEDCYARAERIPEPWSETEPLTVGAPA